MYNQKDEIMPIQFHHFKKMHVLCFSFLSSTIVIFNYHSFGVRKHF